LSLKGLFRHGRGFIALAAVAGLVAVGGCGKGSEDKSVISKRIKIELPAEKLATEKVPEAGEAPGKTAEIAPRAEPAPKAEAALKAEAVSTTEAPSKAPPRVEAPPKAKAVSAPGVEPRPAKVALKFTEAEKTWARKNPWAVNVASFSDGRSAARLKKRLREDGYNAYTTEFVKNGKTWHRVRVGFYPTREKAGVEGKRIELSFRTAEPWIVKPSTAEVVGHME